jgi:PIN domain nuclease of toxin-antitoxin system
MAALIYLDTHVVAWLYAGRTDLLSPVAKAAIDRDELLVSPMVALELEYLHEIERLKVRGETVLRSLHGQLGLRVCDLPFPTIIERAIEQRWTRDPFDRVIVAHALAANCPLLTRDETIRKHCRRAIW